MSALSVIVITKNEESNIRECLTSVCWAEEIVLVDGGSEDQTVELARSLGAKVFERPWDGYGAAKNYALSHCTGEWILWLDADERVTEELANEISQRLRSNDTRFNGFQIARRAYFLGRWMKHSGWYPGHVLRLFRKGTGRFSERKVHEQLVVEGEIGRLKFDLLHFTDPNLFHYFEKFNRYSSLAAEELGEHGQRFDFLQLLVRPPWVFFKMYLIRAGFLDGMQGFILSVLSACYVFTKYAKLWELVHSSRRS